ncbi:MAG: hypothetical protein ACRD1X_12515 [Vicinamibacteria bacterium]
MGAEREAAKPRCPECEGTVYAELHGSEYARRFQCGNPKCFHQWIVQLDRLSQALEAEDEEGVKETDVANDLDCPKCGKEYGRGGHYRDLHVKGCKGPAEGNGEPEREKPRRAPKLRAGGGDGSCEEEPDLPMPAGRAAIATAAPPEGEASVRDQILKMLSEREDYYTERLRETKVLISAVRDAGR